MCETHQSGSAGQNNSEVQNVATGALRVSEEALEYERAMRSYEVACSTDSTSDETAPAVTTVENSQDAPPVSGTRAKPQQEQFSPDIASLPQGSDNQSAEKAAVDKQFAEPDCAPTSRDVTPSAAASRGKTKAVTSRTP